MSDTTGKPTGYQVMPPLSDADYAALKADIATRGIMVPIEVDEDGNVLDGHHRLRIAGELGIHCPRFVRTGFSEDEKRTHARRLNLARRHLDRDQRRALIEAELMDDPGRSNRRIGEALGVSDNTVRAVRQAMESNAQIAQCSTTTTRDGRQYPARRTRPVKTILVSDGDEGWDRAIRGSASTAKREKKAKREAEREEALTSAGELPTSCDLRCESFMEALGLDPESVDLVITDPPYPREYLHLYDGLGQVAAHVLKPGGSLLCMTGNSYLPESLDRLRKHLSYHWTLAYLTPGGQATQIFPRRVIPFWKPVLWFVKGAFAGDWVGDVSRSAANDKRYHHWGQSESGMTDLMRRFVRPGDVILDPFMGAGTTGVVAHVLGASFIGYDIDSGHVETAKRRLTSGFQEPVETQNPTLPKIELCPR